MQNIDDLREEIESRVEEIIDFYQEVKPEELGLDNRAAYRLYVNENYIACRNSSRRTLDYYGGFEYVDADSVFTLGNFTFYSRDDSRVEDHLETYFTKEEAA
jgi:hypothetical protein